MNPDLMPDLPNIFITAGYRTGSTHIAKSLARILRYRRTTVIAPGGSIGDEGHRIDPPAADVLFPMGGFIFQCHAKGSPGNLPILQKHGIRPVIVTRNILDSLTSVFHRFNQATDTGWLGNPMAGWKSLPDRQKWRWLAYNVSPWVISFYVSWLRADIPKLFVPYEGHFRDQVSSIREILEHTGVSKLGKVSDEDIMKFSDRFDNNFSGSGVSGRGKREVPEEYRDMVLDQVKSWGSGHWPDLVNLI